MTTLVHIVLVGLAAGVACTAALAVINKIDNIFIHKERVR